MGETYRCCIHVVDDENGSLQTISAKSRKKIIECKLEWLVLEGCEQSVAQKLDEVSEFSAGITEDSSIDLSYNYHRKCYMRFTDKIRIEKAKKRMQKRKLSTCQTDSPPVKQVRSSREGASSNSLGIFPFICVICEKEKYKYEKCSRKRKREKLVLCQTYNASTQLVTSATQKNDERLMRKIRDVDCIAKEVKYHNSCYRAYTKYIINSGNRSNISAPYAAPYQQFCKDVIMEKIITNGEILPMNKLRTLLIEAVKISNDDAENISNRQLKRWLQRDYPHLTFIKPRQCNLSELVLYNTSNKYVMIDQPEADSTSTETTEAEYNAECSGAWYAREEKANLYKSALFLRNIISESPLLDCSWPPTANDLAETAALKMVPTLLFNFLAWCTGETDSFDPDDIAQVSAQCQKKILCIAQDIIYLSSKGKKQTPKHLSLAMAIRHITGSSKVIQILNGLGHCISHTSTLEFDTALAELQLQSSNSIPAGIRLGIFTTITWDNIDFQEETLTGHNTTHNTNGIIVQRSDGNELTQISKTNKKSKRRTINPPITSISECFFGKKCGPLSQFAITDCQTTELIAGSGAKEIDLAYILCKLPEFNNEILPGWTGFNTKIQAADSIPLSTIRYLPVVEANPTQFSTVHTLLLKRIEIADQLELEQLVVVFDQAIYAKAQQIRWKNDIFQNRLVVRLGEFHVILSFLGILGKRYKDAGLSNIMIESGIVAEGSVSGVMSGKHYNRSIRAHKIIYEALYRLLWTSFLEGVSNEEFIEIQGIVKEIHKSYDMEYLDETVLPPSFNNVMQRFEKFIDERCKANVTFAFWVSYLDMIGCLLQFIRATRIGNWVLHLASLTHMVPWYFAYDRINYARYLPVYLLEMLNLNETHSFIYLKMLNGEFVVQQQNKYGFSGTAFDQVIEQTANKDSKTKGGLVGVTRNSNATHRWLLSHHLRAQISINCLQLAGKNSEQRNRIHLDQARMKIDELSVCNVVSVISSMINPFEWEDNRLVNISSGFVASSEIQKDLERARSVGIAAYKDFKETRLLIKNEKLDIFSPIKLQKLKTFSDLSSSSIPKHKLPDSTINTNKLLAQIVVIGQSTKLDMREIMSYSLTPFPLSISNSDGSLVKTSKAALVHHLLNSIKPQDLSSNCIPEDHKILIIDGMMLIQQMKAIPETFGALASQLLQNVIQKATSHGAHRVDFVTDSYPTISIKNNERERRANCNSTSIKIVNSQQKTPRQFKNFLSNGENKQALIEFLYEEWSFLKPVSLKNINLIIAHGNMCHSFNVTHDKLVITEVPELYCDHEEADTRILLHAAHSSRRVKNVIIWSKDTDVFLISLFACSLLDVKIYMTVNTTSQYQLVNVSNIARMLGDDICAALIGLHVFTGCDSTSAFKGKGKVKAFKLMQNSNKYINTFKQLGVSLDVNSALLSVLQTFVCELYGYPKYEKVNEVRYMLFKLKFKTDLSLPPNFDALKCHVKRANYQTYIHKKCLCPVINAPCPSENGWYFSENTLKIEWITTSHIPEILQKQVSCHCNKTNCKTKQCSCKGKNVFCSILCSCIDCANIDVSLDLSEESDSDTDLEL